MRATHSQTNLVGGWGKAQRCPSWNRPGAPLRSAPATRRGFTLVEMLVVIAIIGVLAGLITAAGVAALGQAKRTTIRMEISGLETALHAYKEKYGDYPPDFFDTTKDYGKAFVVRHLRKAFPKYRLSGTTRDQWDQFADDVLNNYGLDVDYLSPSEAMVFWLGGMPDGSGGMAGFSVDPANPFKAGGTRLDPLFDFDQPRLIDADDSDGWLAYKSEHVKGPVPCVYFRIRICPLDGVPEYEYETSANPPFDLLYWDAGAAGICVPYCVDPVPPPGDQIWNKPKSFQIISPGMDGQFGNHDPTGEELRFSASALNFTDGDYDNITNFSSTTLEDGLE
ncbi:MAG: prepilin-type N-terminal cleavage/methylation domain-containing protein [Thermoguttaceae bacterium]